MTRRSAARHAQADALRPDRAVVDIGSNTVRLVVYRGSPRVPEIWLNERVVARLGRELATTGRMPDRAIDEALTALARYAAILRDHGVDDVQTVATAAVREAANGSAFLERVRALGLEPRLLSGAEEATAAAFGVIGAFPGACGTVADLGGGSLELVMVEDGECLDGISLPLGTLRLPALRTAGPARFREAIAAELRRAGWAARHPGPLYMVGGTWRALAAFAMRRADHPLTDPHAVSLTIAEADDVARQVAEFDPATLAAIPGVGASRAVGLPDAAAMLRVMLDEFAPHGIVFSSWGLREGLLFQRLSLAERRQDPLIAGVTQFAGPRGGSATLATMIAGWTSAVANGAGSERLRLAATMLALAGAQVEPNWRARHAYEWAMEKRWLGVGPEERAKIAAALLAASGKTAPPVALKRLASADALREAAGWGLAVRLCRRLGAGSRRSLASSALLREGDALVLRIDPDRAQLVTAPVVAELRALAGWLGLRDAVRVGEAPERAAAGPRHLHS